MDKLWRGIFVGLFYALIAGLIAFAWFYPWTAESNSWIARGIILALVVAIIFLGLLALFRNGIGSIDVSGGVVNAKIEGEDDDNKA